MLAVTDIEKGIISLPKKNYSDFRKWFYSYDFENWDQELAEDTKSGKLDFLINEAMEEKSLGELKPL